MISHCYVRDLTNLSIVDIIAWEKLNCTGNSSVAQFTNPVLARNISNAQISRSIIHSRASADQQQLDIFVTNNFASWYSNQNQFLADLLCCECKYPVEISDCLFDSD